MRLEGMEAGRHGGWKAGKLEGLEAGRPAGYKEFSQFWVLFFNLSQL
jgi:hypothetical protein